MKKVITITRQFGSGGREIGKKLAEAYGIPFYDNEIISRAAKDTGFAEAAFERAEDKASNSLLYSIAMGMNVFSSQDVGFSGLSLDDRIFLAQSKVIRNVAKEGPCVIVGRCADYILSERTDCLNVFVHGNIEDKVVRVMKYKNIGEKEARRLIKDTDKRRRVNYNYYTDRQWGKSQNYDICLNSTSLGTDNCVNILYDMVK